MYHCVSSRCTACYFDTLIHYNMMANVVVFITLHSYSTILLSMLVIPCIRSLFYLPLVTTLCH